MTTSNPHHDPGHNVDPAEQDKFARIASQWWDPEGDFKPLHDLNPARLKYIQDCAGDLKGLRVVDVGCGGGLLSEAMAACGADVVGIDVTDKALGVARLHLHESGHEIDYRLVTAEQLAVEESGSFDLVTCLEMLEHVPDPAAVIQACAELVKPGGHCVFSTLNRNPLSYMAAVVGAEYVLGLLPRGTHDYQRFIKPSELAAWVRHSGLSVSDIRGMHYNPLLGSVRIGGPVAVNYLLHCQRPDDA